MPPVPVLPRGQERASAAEKNLVLALLAVFVASAVGNVLYVFHLVPIPAIPFPLLSSSAPTTLSFALAGVELSRVVGSAICRAALRNAALGGPTPGR